MRIFNSFQMKLRAMAGNIQGDPRKGLPSVRNIPSVHLSGRHVFLLSDCEVQHRVLALWGVRERSGEHYITIILI